MSFDGLAPHYRWLEALFAGPTMQRARTAWSPLLSDAREILLVGEGPGRGVVRAVEAAPHAHITVVDRSAPMLAAAQNRLKKKGAPGACDRVHWLEADVMDWTPPAGRYDAIATQFFLDCFAPAELARIIAKLAGAATPAARWWLADFHLPAGGWRRRRAQAILAAIYACFRPTTQVSARRLTPPEPLLATHGFRLLHRRHFCAELVHSDVWQRVASGSGTNVAPAEPARLRSG